MIIFNRRFQPSVLMIGITLMAVVLFLALGFWQLERAAYKQTIADRFQERLNADFKPFEPGTKDWSAIEYQPVILEGHYDNRHTLLLDNQLSRGRVGYHVLSPFVLTNGDLVLVNRGWVPIGHSRQQLPMIKTPRIANQVKGSITVPVSTGFRMGQVSFSGHWPQVIPYIDIAALQAGFTQRLLPVVIWLAPEHDDFYERDWRPVRQSPEKSQAYAVQWFCFAVIVFILFFILNLRRLNE